MKTKSIKPLTGILAGLLLATTAAQAGTWDPGWTKSQTADVSFRGLGETYRFGKDYGWIDNDVCNSAPNEGVDCSSYVPRCLAIPWFRDDGTAFSHFTDTALMFNGGIVYGGVTYTKRLTDISVVDTWDIFVHSGHTGLIRTVGSATVNYTTREAVGNPGCDARGDGGDCPSCMTSVWGGGGVRQFSWPKSHFTVDYDNHYYRRKAWGTETPAKPSGLNATAVDWNQIKLTWNDNSDNETGFELEESDVSADGPWGGGPFHTTQANITTWTAGSLTPTTKYWFRARAVNATGSSDWTGVAAAVTLDRYPPNAPSGLTATAVNDDKITLAWTDNSDNEDQFNIQQSTDGGTTWSLIDTVNPNTTGYSVTGLRGNRTYSYHVKAVNTAGDSAWSNTATDTTGPTAPTNLVVTTVGGTTNWDKLNLDWDDMSGAEVGFKVERSSTSGSSGFAQIATTGAGVATYQDTNLLSSTTYWYRVRAWNANANSMYSNVDSKTTRATPPVLSDIGSKTVVATSNLTFRAISTDPNQTTGATNFTDFTGFANGDTGVMFRKPDYNGTTSAFIDTTKTNSTYIDTSFPTGHSGAKVLHTTWSFKTGQTNPFVYLSTDAGSLGRMTIQGKQTYRFAIHPDHDMLVGFTFQETGTSVAYGADGGNTGDTEYVGATNLVSGNPKPSQLMPGGVWTTIYLNCQKDPIIAGSGDGHCVHAKGTARNVILWPNTYPANTQFDIFLDNFSVYTNNTLTFSLLNAPTGATIDSLSGDFSWVPTSGQVGQYTVSVKVVDQLGLSDTNTFKITVTAAANNPPTLAPIGNKTVNELGTLSFTATATDPDVGQTKTFTLDAGAPSGATINSSSGAFSWTPTESQGGSTYPITVRVTDNGSPSSNDFETINVTVKEINTAPSLSSIPNATINEGSTFNYTASATDSDLPANTITYSLQNAPLGMTINTNTGAMSWTTGENDGGTTVTVTVRAKDNGSPSLWADRTFTITITEVNSNPTLAMPTFYDHDVFAAFDELDDMTSDGFNGTCMFRVPAYSGSTSAFISATSYSKLTNSFPTDEINSSHQAGYINFTVLAGATNPWVRLTTFTDVTYTNDNYPNPTIDLGQHVRFKIWTDKSIKLGIGVRETGGSAPLGFDGGTSGTIEWVGVTNKVGNTPQPTRVITASNWTLVDFNLPAEPIYPFTGDGILSSGRGTLEHLAIVPNAGNTNYTIYVDDFENLAVRQTNSITINTADTLECILSATDPDIPAQTFTYVASGAPTNSTLDGSEFTWTPDGNQGPSTNVITFRVIDSGSPAASNSIPVTVIVNKVNERPVYVAKVDDISYEINSGTLSFGVPVTDYDYPAQVLTYTIVSGPTGATINPTNGTFSWTPPATPSTNLVTVRVTDNGVPPLWNNQSFYIYVVPSNSAPVLSLGTARVEETFANFESFPNNTGNGTIMFRQPNAVPLTSAFIDTTVTNYTRVTTSFPTGNTNAGSKVLMASWKFKSGQTNYWMKTWTAGSPLTNLLNPVIELSQRLKFDIYSDKSIKIGLGVRELTTTGEVGSNGGNAGTTNLEWIGVTATNGTMPVCTHTINAATWTTVEFDLQHEAICPQYGFSGNGILTTGQGTLEHLAFVPNGGIGPYNVYMNNFSVVSTSSLPTTITMKAGSTLTFTASATDPDPGTGLTYDLDGIFADTHTNAIINTTNGAFSWTPGTGDIGTTNAITVLAWDNWTNHNVQKSGSQTFTVIVNADNWAPQNGSGLGIVAGNESLNLTWPSVPGATYKVQKKQENGEWIDVDSVTASGTVTSVTLVNEADEGYYLRVVEVSSSASDE